MDLRLAAEILEASESKGSGYEEKEKKVHRMAEANKSILTFPFLI